MHECAEMALPSLKFFNFQNTGRTGYIPTEFFAIPMLQEIGPPSILSLSLSLSLSSSQCAGCHSLSFLWVNLSCVTLSDIGGNALEGTIPTEFALNFQPTDGSLILGPNYFVHPTFPTEFMTISQIDRLCVTASIQCLHPLPVFSLSVCHLLVTFGSV